MFMAGIKFLWDENEEKKFVSVMSKYLWLTADLNRVFSVEVGWNLVENFLWL